MLEAADAYRKGDIDLKKLASEFAAVERASAAMNSRLKDSAARVREIQTTGATHFQNQISGATSGISNIAALLTGNRLSGATTQISAVGSALAAIPGPAGLAAGALAVVGTASVAATAGLFDLILKASEVGSKLHDLGQETGLSAEGISTLKYAADNAGSSIDTVATGVARFSKIVGEALNGTGKSADEAKAKLADLGITPQQALNDLDGTLDKVFQTIYNTKSGVDQITLAQEAFGRSGADLIPVIIQMGGSFANAKEEAERLGLTLSQDLLDAADEFGDKWGTVKAQAENALTAIALNASGPFLDALNSISQWLAENKDEWDSWGKEISRIIADVKASFATDANDAGAIGDFFDVLFSGGTGQDLRAKWAKRREESERIANEKLASQFGNSATLNGQKYVFDQYNNVVVPDPGFGSLQDKSRRKFSGFDDDVLSDKAKADKKDLADSKKEEREHARELKEQMRQIAEETRKAAQAAKEWERNVEQLKEKASRQFDATLSAYNLRSQAKEFSQGFRNEKGTVSEELAKAIDAITPGRLVEKVVGYAGGGSLADSPIVKMVKDASKLTADQQAAFDKEIIKLTNGLNPEDLTRDQNNLAAAARNREADRILKERDAINKALIDAINNGNIVKIINEAPDNAKVTKNPTLADVNNRYK